MVDRNRHTKTKSDRDFNKKSTVHAYRPEQQLDGYGLPTGWLCVAFDVDCGKLHRTEAGADTHSLRLTQRELERAS